MPTTSVYTFKNPVKYNESAVLLYLISLEITNLMKEIREQSSVLASSKQAPTIFTPEQIEAARKNPTKFVNRAIATAAKRQIGLNKTALRIAQIKNLFKEIEAAIIATVDDPTLITADDMTKFETALKTLKKKESDLLALQNAFKTSANAINQLISKHSSEWQQHKQKYSSQLITELERGDILLSELEKQELKAPTKTIEEVKELLKKHNLL